MKTGTEEANNFFVYAQWLRDVDAELVRQGRDAALMWGDYGTYYIRGMTPPEAANEIIREMKT
jgi:hypothetical protein